jgi:RNA polymerase sigma factor (TIGR02999 family)
MKTDEITLWLGRAAAGDDEAQERVAAWAYGDLERLAARRLRRAYGARAAALTLEPAALVNETFLRLLESPVGFDNRRHFLAFASRVMLSALVDYQRGRSARKRGGDRVRVTLSGLVEDRMADAGIVPADFAKALAELETLDARKADVVRLRVLWGAASAETARLLEISIPTVERDWRFARSWLADRLEIEP